MLNLVIQILFAILALSLLIAWHEFGHYLIARLTGMRVLQFSIGFGPKIIGFTKSGIEYRLGLLPIGGYVQIAGMSDLEEGASEDPKSFVNRPFWAQVSTIAAGPLFNYFLAFVLFFFVFWSYSGDLTPRIMINGVSEGSAAQEAGILAGDALIKVDGQPVDGTADFLRRIREGKGQPMDLDIRRGEVDLKIKASPRFDGTTYKLGLAGLLPVDLTFLGALKESGYNLWSQSTGILSQLGQSIFGKGDSGVSLGGPVQIVRELSNTASLGFRNFLGMLGGLSLVLGLFNILPIPALDGSKILFLGIEKLIGRKIPSNIQIGVHIVGIVLILGLMLVLTVFDVLRIYNAS